MASSRTPRRQRRLGELWPLATAAVFTLPLNRRVQAWSGIHVFASGMLALLSPLHVVPEFALRAYNVPPSHDEASLVTPEGRRCQALFSLVETSLEPLVQQLRDCGFVYLAPGSAVDLEWIAAAEKKVRQMWAALKKDPALVPQYATPIPAGGKRVDMVIPQQPSGAFNASAFDHFAPALFELLEASLGSAPPALQMMVVKNALRFSQTGNPETDGREQTWHDDSLPGLFDQQLGVAIALHDMHSGLIAVQPGCFPPEGYHHRLDGEHGSGTAEPLCYTGSGYVPERLAAGTVLVHRARLRHRGLWNFGPEPTRFMLQLNVAPRGGDWLGVLAEKTAHGRGRWGEIHAQHRAAFEQRLEVVKRRRDGGQMDKAEL